MYNKVFLIGRVVNEPSLKYSQQGKAISTFSIAVDRTNEETDFFEIVSFDKQAEIASKYLTKGRLIMIEGRIQTRTYESQDGTKRKIYEIIAESFRMLDKKPDQERKEEMKLSKKSDSENTKYDKMERKEFERKVEKSYQKPYKEFDEFDDIDEDFEKKPFKSKPKRFEEDDFEDFFFDEN